MTELHPIGASEMAVPLGLQQRRRDGTPYTSGLELWARLRGLVPRYDDRSSPAAEAGRIAEPGIGIRAGQELGWWMAPGPQIPEPGWSCAELPWLAVRPDFVGYVDQRPVGLVEAKAPRVLDEAWGTPGTAEIPVHYAVQGMSQLAVVGRIHPQVSTLYLAAHARDARPGDRVWGLWRIDRDLELERQMLQRAHDWYRRHVEDGEVPLPDGSESASQTLARIWRPVREEVEATTDDVRLWRRLCEIRADLDELYAERRELEQKLQLRLGEATELVHQGQQLATWRPTAGAERIDIARLRRERPDVAAAYLTQGDPARSFRVQR